MNLDNDIIIWFHVRRSRKNLTDDIYKIDSTFCLCPFHFWLSIVLLMSLLTQVN